MSEEYLPGTAEFVTSGTLLAVIVWLLGKIRPDERKEHRDERDTWLAAMEKFDKGREKQHDRYNELMETHHGVVSQAIEGIERIETVAQRIDGRLERMEGGLRRLENDDKRNE